MLLGFLDRAVGGWRPRLSLVLRGRAIEGRAIAGWAIIGRDHQSLSHCGSSHRGSGLLWVKLSQVKLLRVNPLRVNHRWLSYRRCDVNKRQGHFRGRKNDRLVIGKKPPNLVGTEEENQCKKDLVVVQSSRINLCGQWYVELLLHSQSTITAKDAWC